MTGSRVLTSFLVMKESIPHPHIAIVRDAIAFYGSQAALAQVMGCSQQYISWLLNSPHLKMSAEMATKLHSASGGLFPKHLMRPDLFEAPASPQLKEAV